MKLYFPTSSLNFNDIFATESISPSYAYNERCFGTKNHNETELARNEMYLTLFSKIPYFELIDQNLTEYEQYPIVIEVVVDNIKGQFTKINDEVYITGQTIYFERENMKVYFFSNEHLKIVLVKSRLANETKLVKKYEKNFSVIDKENSEKIQIQGINYPTLNIRDKELTLKFDKKFNFIKGLYYSYIIQKYKSCYIGIYNRYTIHLERLEYIKKSLEVKDQNGGAVTLLIENMLATLEKSQKKLVEDLENELDIMIQKMEAFCINDRNKIELNRKVIKITRDDIVFEIILNNIIQNPKSRAGNIDEEEIFRLIANIGKAMTNENAPNVYKNDITLIYKRIVKREQEINIENINSVVMKNFFAFLLKYNNIEELNHFISLKKIENDYFCYSYYGAFYGFSGLSRIFTHDLFLSENIQLFDIIDYNIQKLKKQIMNSLVTDNYIKQEIISNNYGENHESNQSNTNLYNNELTETDKLIYCQIKTIKESKKITSYINRKSINIISNNSKIIFDFKKNNNNDVEVNINYMQINKKFKLSLYYKKNCSDIERKEFKNAGNKLNLDKKLYTGNYPVFKYNLDNESSMNEVDKNQLLACLLLLTNGSVRNS